jgi:elongation factor G
MPSNRTIRTFCLTGADGAGKTALVEAFLRLADAKRASPEGSTSRLDAEPEEKKRNFTLTIHPQTFEEGGRSFHALDTPGFASFLAEVDWALRVTDGALLVVSAADGAHNRAERHYDLLAESGLPVLAVVGRIDHEQADFAKTLADIESSLKVKPIPLHVPLGAGSGVKGLVDVLAQKAHVYDKAFAKWTEQDVPADLKAEVEAARTAAVEAAAESDDELLGKYLEGGALSDEELVLGLAKGAAQQKFLPVAVAAPKLGVGVRELLDLVVKLLPAPESRTVKGKKPGGEEVTVSGSPQAPFLGQVFRTTIDHFAGRVDYVRVFAGTLRPDAVLVDPRTRTEERIAHFYRTDGAQNVEVKEAGPGDLRRRPRCTSSSRRIPRSSSGARPIRARCCSRGWARRTSRSRSSA